MDTNSTIGHVAVKRKQSIFKKRDMTRFLPFQFSLIKATHSFLFRLLCCGIGCLLLTNSTFSQGIYKAALQNYRTNFLPEKVFLHTDKEMYAAGETIWGAAYLVDGQTHKPTAFSTTVHVSLVNANQEVISSLQLFLIEGSAPLSLELPTELPSGSYQLQAYTNYQQNSGLATLFRKSISIVNDKEEALPYLALVKNNQINSTLSNNYIDLQFFPEGGDCVVGLPCKMAVVAQDPKNRPLALDGKIFDETEEFITFFKTNEQGMGEFSFIPKIGVSYKAKINDRGTGFSLPLPMDKGYILQVHQREKDVSLLIQTNLPEGLQQATVVVHHRGLPFIEEPLHLSDSKTVIPIKKEDLLPGVYVATVFNAKAIPMVERLFFVAPDSAATKIDIALSAEEVNTKQPLDIQLLSEFPLSLDNDSLLASQVSLSVVPSFASLSAVQDIRTWLLLNSDLDVPIQDAKEILFSFNTQARDYLIDQFLMTRGWRRFRWKEILNKPSFVPNYDLEQGLSIKGKLLKKGTDNTPQVGKVFLSQMIHEIHDEKVTDAAGNFSFGPYVLYDTSTFILQGRFKKGKTKNKAAAKITFEDNPTVDIKMQEKVFPQLPIQPIIKTLTLAFSLTQYETLSEEVYTNDRNFSSLTVDFDVVDITAKRIDQKKQQRKDRSYLYNGTPSFRMVLDEDPILRNAIRVLDLLERIPGVAVVGNNIFLSGGPTSFVAGTDPLFVLDGTPVSKESALSLPVRDIEFMDVLKGADATIYGTRGGNGVILIYTARRMDWEEVFSTPPGLHTTQLIGYHRAKEFATITTPTSATYKPDVRTTLHWNPTILLPNKKQVIESFTTSDKAGNYLIVVQGIRKNGVPLFGSLEFEVE